MVDSVVGIKPRAVQLKVWFGINYVLEKKGSSQFLDTSPALQRLTCAWKEDWNLRIHFSKETIKSVDTLSSASSPCHQETTHVQSSGSIQKASMRLPCCMSSKNGLSLTPTLVFTVVGMDLPRGSTCSTKVLKWALLRKHVIQASGSNGSYCQGQWCKVHPPVKHCTLGYDWSLRPLPQFSFSGTQPTGFIFYFNNMYVVFLRSWIILDIF